MSKMFESIKQIKIKKYVRFLVIFLVLSIAALLFDQATKYIAQYCLTGANGEKLSVTFIPHFIDFTLVYNLGAAFGMGDGAIWSRVLLCIVSWVVFIGLPIYIIYAMAKDKKLDTLYTICLALVWGGNLGNLIDRTFFFNRGVIDFISINSWFPGFGVFNIADSCLVVGLLLLIVYFVIEEFKEQKAEKLKNEAALAKAKELDKVTNLQEPRESNDNKDETN